MINLDFNDIQARLRKEELKTQPKPPTLDIPAPPEPKVDLRKIFKTLFNEYQTDCLVLEKRDDMADHSYQVGITKDKTLIKWKHKFQTEKDHTLELDDSNTFKDKNGKKVEKNKVMNFYTTFLNELVADMDHDRLVYKI